MVLLSKRAPSFPFTRLSVILFGYLLLLCTTAFVSAECWTCQVDNDCTPTGINETTVFSVCNQDVQLCVHKDDNLLRAIDCPCSNGEDCDSGRCEGLFGQATCQPRLQAGESCNEDSDCLSGSCSTFGFVCLTPTPTTAPIAANPTTIPTVPTNAPTDQALGNDGDSCFSDEDCKSGRCEGLFLLSTCEPRLSIGEACSEDSDCLSSNCVEGQCDDDDNEFLEDGEMALDNGFPCTANGDCKSQRCDDSICKQPPQDIGMRCNDDSDCLSGNCVDLHCHQAYRIENDADLARLMLIIFAPLALFGGLVLCCVYRSKICIQEDEEEDAKRSGGTPHIDVVAGWEAGGVDNTTTMDRGACAGGDAGANSGGGGDGNFSGGDCDCGGCDCDCGGCDCIIS